MDPIPTYHSARDFIVISLNTKLAPHLPETHDRSQLYPNTSLYFKQLNGMFLREVARNLLKRTSNWPISNVVDFLKFVIGNEKENSLILIAIFFMMYRYHEVVDQLDHMDIFRSWLETSLLKSRKVVDEFSEYVMNPILNYNETWRTQLLDWTRSSSVWVRRTAATSLKKCAMDKDKVEEVLKVVRELLENCSEKEVQSGIGQVLCKVGRKRPSYLERFLEENLTRIPLKSLKMGITRLSKKSQEMYLLRHKLAKTTEKVKEKDQRIINFDLLGKSLNSKLCSKKA